MRYIHVSNGGYRANMSKAMLISIYILTPSVSLLLQFYFSFYIIFYPERAVQLVPLEELLAH